MPGRGHPTTPWHTLKIKPIPYNRIAGQKAGAEKIEKGGAGAVEGRVETVSKNVCHDRIQRGRRRFGHLCRCAFFKHEPLPPVC